MVDVMSHWDDDFAIDFGRRRRWERRKMMMRTIPSPILDQTNVFDRLKSWGWASSFDEGADRSGSRFVSRSGGESLDNISPVRASVLSMDDKTYKVISLSLSTLC